MPNWNCTYGCMGGTQKPDDIPRHTCQGVECADSRTRQPKCLNAQLQEQPLTAQPHLQEHRKICTKRAKTEGEKTQAPKE
eukprot:1156863-Pelagomonas_calceolata.AAC.6